MAPLSRRIDWPTCIVLAGYHMGALVVVLLLFSWIGLAIAILGVYAFGVLGINIGFHRLLTHRSFGCSKRLEHILVMLGVCCLQGTPAQWIAMHRRHHQHSDDRHDPHSPRDNFFWSHVGWVLLKTEDASGLHGRYAKDILRDPFYARLQRFRWLTSVIVASWLVVFLGGFAGELLAGSSVAEAARCGATIFLWGVVVRTVLVWHITWSVNSVTHLWGYRSYPTDDASRNNIVIGILAGGEGWHNNHHADPRSAKHGHVWWELDVSYLTIRLFAQLGLVGKIVMPRGMA